MRLPSLVPALVAFAALPFSLHGQDAAITGPLPLTDDEIRPRLTRDEAVVWNRAAKQRDLAERDLRRGKELQIPPRVQLKGSAEESSEARAARGADIVAKAAARIDAINKSTEGVRNAVTARMTVAARRAPCPVVMLADVFKKAAADIIAAAKENGYERLAVAGVFTSNGETVTADSGFTSAFLAAFSPADNTKPELPLDAAPSFARGKLTTVAPKTAVVVAEMHPMRGIAGLDGMLWTCRITDPATASVKRAFLAYVPSGQNVYSAPPALEAVFYDRRDFLEKLGPFADHPFGMEGIGVVPSLLRAALVTGGGKPPLDDIRFFVAASRGETASDTVSKAIWSTASDKGRHFVLSRRAGTPASSAIRVGEVLLGPPLPPPEGR